MALRTNTLTRHFASNTTAFSMGWTKVFTETAGSTFADVTTAASSTSTGDVTMLGAVGDILDLGSATPFDFVRLTFDTTPNGGTRTWQYWDGSTWSTLTVSAGTGSANLTSSSNELTWTPPTDWTTTTVNGASAYWIRSVNATLYSTAGVGSVFTVGNLYDFGGAMTFDIAETSSRTIRSALVRISWHPDDSTPNIQTRVSCKLGSNAASYVLDSSLDFGPGADSRMHTGWIEADATSYFASNFGAGASESFLLQASITSAAGGHSSTLGSHQNITGSVTVTYEYDDASLTTATKTVFIPIESPTSILSTSLTEVGTNQVPELDTFCPEASKTFKEICFVLGGVSQLGNNNGTSHLYFALDAESDVDQGAHTDASTCGIGTRDIFHWVRNDMTTSAVHALKVRTDSTSLAPFLHFGGYLAVTYTYNAATTTTVLNSLRIPVSMPECSLPAAVSGDSGTGVVDLWIEEPGSIALQQSAAQFLYVVNDTTDGWPIRLKVGSQSFRSYTGSGGTYTGTHQIFHRFDSGSAGGAGLTLARGKNRLVVEFYYGTSTDPLYSGAIAAFSGMVILNYTSAKAAAGIGAHNHTTCWPVQTGLPSSLVTESNASADGPIIPEADHFVNVVGLSADLFTTYAGSMGMAVEQLSGEREQEGWRHLRLVHKTQSHSSYTEVHVDASGAFQRGSWDTDSDRLVVASARKYSFSINYSGKVAPVARLYLTYHSVTFAWAGTVVDGSATPQVGATVTLHRNDTGEIVGTATTDGSGNYSIPWFDDTVPVHSQVRISGSLLGRSDDDVCT
jgi:hypothetical protein